VSDNTGLLQNGLGGGHNLCIRESCWELNMALGNGFFGGGGKGDPLYHLYWSP